MLEPINQSEGNNEKCNGYSDIPKFALALQYGGSILKIHSEVRCEE